MAFMPFLLFFPLLSFEGVYGIEKGEMGDMRGGGGGVFLAFFAWGGKRGGGGGEGVGEGVG